MNKVKNIDMSKKEQKKQPARQQTQNEGTGRFTLGGESGGRGRIKRRDTNRLDDDDD